MFIYNKLCFFPGGKNQVNLILSHYSPAFCEINPSLSASPFSALRILQISGDG